MRCFLLAMVLVHTAAADSPMYLRRNWTLQSSAAVAETGAALSTAGFRPAIPGTRRPCPPPSSARWSPKASIPTPTSA